MRVHSAKWWQWCRGSCPRMSVDIYQGQTVTNAEARFSVALRPQKPTGFQARSRDLRGGRWSWTLTYAQKRSWVGRWSWAEQVGRLLLWVVQVVRQQRCNGHCLSDSVQHNSWNSNYAVHKSLGSARGHRLNTSIVLEAVHGLSGLFRTVSEPSLSRPLPTLSPSLIGHLASVDVKQHESRNRKAH